MPFILIMVVGALALLFGLIVGIMEWIDVGFGSFMKKYFVLVIIGAVLIGWVATAHIMSSNGYEEYLYPRMYQYENGSVKQVLNLKNKDQVDVQKHLKKIVAPTSIVKIYKQEEYTLGIWWIDCPYRVEEITPASSDHAIALERVTNDPQKTPMIIVNGE